MAKRRHHKSPFKAELPPVEIGLLYPPIPGDHENADGGIGLRHVEVPLVVHIARPPATPKTTSFQLYWADVTVAVAFNQIREGDEDLTRIPFTVPLNVVREAWASPIFARVIRPSGNPSETAPLRLRVNLKRPAGQAPEPTQDGNRNLVLVLPPDVEIGGVSDERAKLGVVVTLRHWLNMAAYDFIRLVWGSEIIEHWVQPGEVGSDISLTVNYATIVEAGDSELLPVAFQVIGNTGNTPDPRAPWSVPHRVSVYLRSDRLDAPWLEFPKTAPNIDLIELGNQPVKIGLYVSANDARVYERVFLIWAGANEGGSVPYVSNQELPVGRTYYFDVPNDLVKAIANGSAVVHYTLEGNGVPPKRSHNLYLSIIGAVVQWLAPWVVEQVGGIIDPSLDVITVQFPEQATWRPDDLIQVNLLYSDPNNTIDHKASARFDSLPNQSGTLSFVLPDANINRFDGLRMEVFYVLLRNGQESLREAYQVGEPKRDMPAPEIEKAVGGQLDPDDVPVAAKVLAPFSGTLANDKMTLYWNGPVSSTQVEKYVVQSGTQTEFEVTHSFVAANRDQQVFASYTLERGTDTPRYSEITPVLIAHGLLDLPPPDLRQASITGPGTATLAPLSALNGAHLVVKYSGMNKDDDIKVKMLGTVGDGSPDIPSKPGDTVAQKVVFNISEKSIAANIGNSDRFVTFEYLVTRKGKPTDSQVLTVTLMPIPVESLPQVRINNVNDGGILDTDTFNGNALASLNKWHFSAAGQHVWISCKSTGVPDLEVLVSHPVIPSEANFGLEGIAVMREWLESLPLSNTSITVTSDVTLDGSNQKAKAINFRATQYVVRRQEDLYIDYTSFEDYSYNGWQQGPAADPRDLNFRTEQGRVRLYNYTYSNNAGVLLRKTFNNVRIGGRYRFSAHVARLDLGGTRPTLPIISLDTSQGPVVAATTITGTNWHVLSGEFVANSRTIEFRFNHLQANHDGNDYDIARFNIQLL